VTLALPPYLYQTAEFCFVGKYGANAFMFADMAPASPPVFTVKPGIIPGHRTSHLHHCFGPSSHQLIMASAEDAQQAIVATLHQRHHFRAP